MSETSRQNNPGEKPGENLGENSEKNTGAIIKTALVLGAIALTVYIVFIYAAVSASG